MLLLTCAALFAATPSPDLYELPIDDFVETALADLTTLRRLSEGMERLVSTAEANRRLFIDSGARVYAPDDKRLVLTTWGSMFGYFTAAEALRQKYWGFGKRSPTDPRHHFGYLLTHAALTAELANGLTFAQLSRGNKQLEVLLDEANADYGVPAGSFATFKFEAINVATSTQLMTGDGYAVVALPLLAKQRRGNEAIVTWAIGAMKSASKKARAVLKQQGRALYVANAKDIAVDTAWHTVFPLQKDVAEWMGDTRVARLGRPLVSTADVAERVLPKLQPGDVVVTRQNWFLSNVGLPGFWPHAELYVGTPDDLSRAFDADPGVTEWVARQPEKVSTFTALLRARYPSKWASYATGADFQGHRPIRVIESISEGVSFTAVEHAFGVDYLGVMRPTLSGVEKARAIERAFRYQGRPYDFDFDFFSDATLVCTELVFKSYQPGEGLTGLELPLVEVAGRKTLPANEIVRAFDAQPADRPQLQFVLFLDGRERGARVVEADEAAFRASWRRVKWDVAQQ